MIKKGKLLILEGVDGAGKSTTAKALEKLLKKQGYEVVLTGEPKHTTLGNKVHSLAKDFQKIQYTFCDNFLLSKIIADNYWLAMIDNLINNIIPALDKGKVVICDRSWISTLVYQLQTSHYNIRTSLTLYELLKILEELEVYYFLLDADIETIKKRLAERQQTSSKQILEDQDEDQAFTTSGLPPRQINQINDDPDFETIENAMYKYKDFFQEKTIGKHDCFTIEPTFLNQTLGFILEKAGFGKRTFTNFDFMWN